MKRTHAQRREHSRGLILSAATRLFADRGFEGVRLDEIAEVAGVRRSLLLYYFSSKEELWQAAAEKVAQAFNSALQEKTRAARERDPQNLLHGSIASSLEAFSEQPDYPRFLVREGGVAGPRLNWLITHFAYVDVNYGSASVQQVLNNTIVRDVFFAILLSMTALGPLMDAWLANVTGRSEPGVYPMSSETRDTLVQVLTGFLNSIDSSSVPKRAS